MVLWGTISEEGSYNAGLDRNTDNDRSRHLPFAGRPNTTPS